MFHRSGAIYGICKPFITDFMNYTYVIECILVSWIIKKGLQICFMELNVATDEHLITCPS
jgi:hypothetical protein